LNNIFYEFKYFKNIVYLFYQILKLQIQAAHAIFSASV